MGLKLYPGSPPPPPEEPPVGSVVRFERVLGMKRAAVRVTQRVWQISGVEGGFTSWDEVLDHVSPKCWDTLELLS
jgi:hypothetical protein